MSAQPEDGNNKPKNWMTSLVEGGLPQLAAGPAGAALSRLLGGIIEIPGAKLDGVAQGIRDNTEAKSIVMRAIAAAVGAEAAKDREVLDRAMSTLVAKSLREQRTKDDVVRRTVDYLRIEPPPLDGAGPTEDWLNVFEEYVTRASSDEVRDLYARLLSGEIRKPGAVSLRTLQVLSTMDTGTAKLFEQVCLYVWDSHLVPQDALPEELNYSKLMDLEDAGLLELGGGLLGIDLQLDERNYITFKTQQHGVVADFEPGTRPRLSTYALTRAGKDLAALLKINADIEAFAKALNQMQVKPKLVKSGAVKFTGPNSYVVQNPQPLSPEAGMPA
jgi:hypothetical protein